MAAADRHHCCRRRRTRRARLVGTAVPHRIAARAHRADAAGRATASRADRQIGAAAATSGPRACWTDAGADARNGFERDHATAHVGGRDRSGPHLAALARSAAASGRPAPLSFVAANHAAGSSAWRRTAEKRDSHTCSGTGRHQGDSHTFAAATTPKCDCPTFCARIHARRSICQNDIVHSASADRADGAAGR